MPILVEPAAILFTPDRHEVGVLISSQTDAVLELTVERPDWLAGQVARLAPDERRHVPFRLLGEPFAEAVAGLPAGATLDGSVVFKDQFDRILPVGVHAVPAAADDVDLTLLDTDEHFVRVGEAVSLTVQARVESVPLVGTELVLAVPDGIESVASSGTTDDEGRATFVVAGATAGQFTVSISLAAFGSTPPVTARIQIAAADPCAADGLGRNICGDAVFWACTAAPDGTAACVDVDECEPNRQGQNGCGLASRWICANVQGAAPECLDLDECAVNNGDCGPAEFVLCANIQGAAPRCDDIDECAADNGGCGDPSHARCLDQPAAAPLCQDVNECVPDELGNTGCGAARYTRCENRDRVPPLCTDIDECATNNGGCGAARYTRCTNQDAAAPLCTDVDECAVDEQGRNACGVASRWVCTNLPGAEPICRDIQECATDNGGCGNPAWTRCVERDGAEPACEDVRDCVVNEGRNVCGDARYWTCTEGLGEPATCDDVDECEVDRQGFHACGGADAWRCTNLRGRAPVCEDIDECAVDLEGNNACGAADRWTCLNREDLPPVCTDINECDDNNGGCGDEELWQCVNLPGTAPQCADRDQCTPDRDGINGCGEARFWDCFDRVGLPPICRDRDECEVDDAGRNACGDERYWTCSDNDGAPPDCADIDECAVLNGGCGSAQFTRCVNGLGVPARCVDIDECAQGNGGSGDVRFTRCVNRVGLAQTCEDRDLCAADLNGHNACGLAARWQCTNTDRGPAICVDINECTVVDGQNECGTARQYQCVNQEGADPVCQGCAVGTTNLDLDLQNGCEYVCGPPSSELCNSADDNCDGRVDEGFDFQNSRAHCGACGQTCVDRPGAQSVTCRGGRCLVDRCEPGRRDDNGDGADGCEIEVDTNTIFVDQFNAQPNPDGTAENPYPGLVPAVLAAEPGNVISIAPGVYTANLVIYTPDIVLEGAGMDLVTIQDTDGVGTVIDVRANNVTLTGFTVTGGQTAVRFIGSGENQRLTRGRMYRVRTTNQRPPQTTPNFPGTAASGIRVQFVDRVAITACEVSRVVGGLGGSEPSEGQFGQDGGPGTGIHVSSSAGTIIDGNVIDDIIGGPGERPRNVQRGGIGATGSGIRFDGVTGATVSGNTITSIRGGSGGPSAPNSGSGGPGGSGIGIFVDTSASCTVTGNSVAVVEGGIGGMVVGSQTASGGNGGGAIGTLVRNSSTVTLDGLSIRNLTGGAGGAGDQAQRDGSGATAYGLQMQDTSASPVRHLSVSRVATGQGRALSRTAGVLFRDASGSSLSFGSIYDVGAGSASGDGIWIHAEQVATVDVRNTIVSDVTRDCVTNEAAPDAVRLAYVNLWSCAGEANNGAVVAGPVLELSPGFVSPGLGDLHLTPTSACVDAGDPDAPYDLEPEPNGCRADLGAYGNSPFATPAGRDDIDHCE